ncbi:MAG: type IV pilus modification PilV family protein [Isosphaeraceae bacterium]
MITRTNAVGRRGITLTEILIAIFIMAIGLISLATLFPIGLLRLREAQRQTRSAYLAQSAAADVQSHGLLQANSFLVADYYNTNNLLGVTYNPWFYSAIAGNYYNPLIQDTPYYGGDPYDPNNPGASSPASGGYGLPFAYDPLWRWQTDHANGGIYPFDTSNPHYAMTPEARFASGAWLQALAGGTDFDQLAAPSAYGLQRLTNFNRPAYVNAAGNAMAAVMPLANIVPNIFVSPEDVVWQDTENPSNTVSAYTTFGPGGGAVIPTASPVIPDLNMSGGTPTNDWRFTWMITAQQTSIGNVASFDGNVVVFENRQFGLDQVAAGVYQATGENVYEGVFGPSRNILAGYGSGADRTVLIRWFANYQPDPVVKVGDWIADVTYERMQNIVNARFLPNGGAGYPNPLNNGEWDNLPAQRCYWYQVVKVNPAQPDMWLGVGFRSMTVTVNRKLEARTLLSSNGIPVYRNAVLVCPNVVNVIPQTFFIR